MESTEKIIVVYITIELRLQFFYYHDKNYLTPKQQKEKFNLQI